MLLLDLLRIMPREIAERIGTDTTLISRWRTGNRRLIAGRSWVRKVAAYFVERDDQLDEPVIAKIMAALYPGKPCDTSEQRVACVMQFLLNPGQQEIEYLRRRYELLSPVMPGVFVAPKSADYFDEHAGESSSGKQKMMAAVMEFMGIIAQSRTGPVRMIVIAPDGLNPLTKLSPNFTVKLLKRLMDLFTAGHTLALCVGPDYKPRGSEQFLARFEAMHLGGYVETHYCNDFKKQDPQQPTMVLSAKHDICISISVPDGNIERAQILTVKSTATASKTYAMAAKLCDRMPEHHRRHLLQSPGDFISDIKEPLSLAQHAYMLSELPVCCVFSCDEMASLYCMSDIERDLIATRLWPMGLDPTRFEGGRVHHVFCQDEIERALIMNEIELRELTIALGRPVYIDRDQLLMTLRRMLALLSECDQYELALLPRHVMDRLKLHAIIIEGECALGFGLHDRSAATRDKDAVMSAFRYGEYVWKRIPNGMKSRSAAIRAIQSILDNHASE